MGLGIINQAQELISFIGIISNLFIIFYTNNNFVKIKTMNKFFYMILTEKIEQKILNSQKEYEELIYFNIKKKKGNNKSLKINISDDGMFGLNEKFNFEGLGNEEEVKNFNEINKKSIMTVNERLKNIIYKIRERKRLLRKMKNNGK